MITQLVKYPPAMWETPVPFLGWEDPLEKGKAIHYSILAWRIHSPWGCKESDTTEWLSLSYTYKGINDMIAKIKVLKVVITLLLPKNFISLCLDTLFSLMLLIQIFFSPSTSYPLL